MEERNPVHYTYKRGNTQSDSPERPLTDRSKPAYRKPLSLHLTSLLNTLKARNTLKLSLLTNLQTEVTTQLSVSLSFTKQIQHLDSACQLREAELEETESQQTQLEFVLQNTRRKTAEFKKKITGLEAERSAIRNLERPISIDLSKAQRKSREMKQEAALLFSASLSRSIERTHQIDQLRAKKDNLDAKTARLLSNLKEKERKKQVI